MTLVVTNIYSIKKFIGQGFMKHDLAAPVPGAPVILNLSISVYFRYKNLLWKKV